MARRCGKPNKPCGMSQGLFNPFFQNGAQWMGGGSTPDPDVDLTAILGTLVDPISAGSTINSANTWCPMQSLPVESTLKEVKIYCTGSGTVKIKVLQSIKGGSFNVISNQTVSVVSGLNTFSVLSGTLNEVVMPANSFVGLNPSGSIISFKGSEAPLYSAGYMAGTGDLSGNAVVLNSSAAYGNEIQAQFSAEFDRVSPGDYIIDEDFAGTKLPSFAVNTTTAPWTFTAGKITNAGIGLVNFFDFFPTTNQDRCTWQVEFQFKAAGDRFSIFRKPVLGDASASEGTIIEADLDNNRLVVYQTWSGGSTLPSVRSNNTLTNLTLSTGVWYRLELIKVAKVITFRITDTSTLISDTVIVDNAASDLCGLAYGRPGMAAIAGTVDVRSARLFASVVNPKTIILGDSITEGSGASDSTCYAQLSLDQMSGNGWYSGDGGTTAANVLRRLRHALRMCVPRYVVIYIGANNANSGAATTAFQTDIVNIYNTIVNAGATPVICTLTPNSDGTQNGRVQTMNTFLLAHGWRLSRFDLALSLGNDGVTYNAAMMADSVHPNVTGHALLKARLQSDWPEIFV